MLSKEKSDQLTPRQIVRLAAAIPINNMVAIAEGFMDISDTTIKNLQYVYRHNAEAFNREVIKYWANKNPVDQVQVNNIAHSTFSYAFTRRSSFYI